MSRLPLLPSPARALSNARRASAAITVAVAERRALTGHLDDVPAGGDLVRLTAEECWELLTSRAVGRLAYVARQGVPDVVPVNYVVDGRTIVVRTGPGPKLQAAQRREVVAFEVDVIDEETHTGWSVVVHGRAEELPRQQSRHPEPAPWANGPRLHTVRITARHVAGRRLHGEPET
jgi:hypothetical protein